MFRKIPAARWLPSASSRIAKPPFSQRQLRAPRPPREPPARRRSSPLGRPAPRPLGSAPRPLALAEGRPRGPRGLLSPAARGRLVSRRPAGAPRPQRKARFGAQRPPGALRPRPLVSRRLAGAPRGLAESPGNPGAPRKPGPSGTSGASGTSGPQRRAPARRPPRAGSQPPSGAGALRSKETALLSRFFFDSLYPRNNFF